MFLAIRIRPDGYIQTKDPLDKTVHKESINLHYRHSYFDTLAVALDEVQRDSETALLELTEEGAGSAIWMEKSQIDTLVPRLNKWRGCYGGWEIKKLNG